MLTIFFGCTPILKPVMLENLNKESTTLDNLVEYLQKNNMKVINEFEPEIEERSTPIGTITLVEGIVRIKRSDGTEEEVEAALDELEDDTEEDEEEQ